MSDRETGADFPLKESVERVRGEFDRLVGLAMEQGGRALETLGLGETGIWTPAVDMLETADDVCVLVNLPGIDPDDVEIHIAGNMLTIKGEVPDAEAGDDETVHLRERSKGPFSRSVPLPVAVNTESVSADYNNGVLTVQLAKAESAKVKTISVKVRGNKDRQDEQD